MSPLAAPPHASGQTKQADPSQRQPMHDDPERVKSFITDRVQADVRGNAARKARDRADLQALMFYRGGEDNQWTVWDPNTQTYVPRPSGTRDESALPEWFFRATTNLFATKIDGVTSIMNQSQPAQEIGPEHDDDKERAAAEVAEEALPVLYEEMGYPALRAQINKLVALTNAVALHIYYDNDDRWGMADLPILQCQQCQQYFMPDEVPDGDTCPECGAPAEQVDMAMDPRTNMPMSTPAPRGKVCARLLTSFEFSVPRAARELHEERVGWIAGHGRMDPTEVIGLWPSAKGHVDTKGGARSDGSQTQSATYADKMRALAAPGPANDTSLGQAHATPAGPIVWFIWADPIDDDQFYFPEGLYAVMLDEELVLEQGPLPLKDDQGRPVKNVLLRTYQATPGSPWGKPPADDLVPLQKQLNLCQSLAFLILMHEAAPTTYIPDTVTLLEQLTGMPGATVPFKSIRGGDKPFVTGGQGFPESLKWFLEYLVGQFDAVSKLNAVLQGSRPQGDPTLGEVEILRESGLAAFKEPLDLLVEFEKRLSRILLWTARQSMWSPRFYTVTGENGEWDVKQFMGSDLEGSVSIHVEPTSAWPASQLLTNLRLQQALERGMLNPQDPEVQAQYLSVNNLSDFKKSTDENRKQVGRQIDAWKAATSPQQIGPPDPLWDLPLHFFLKVTWLRTEQAEILQAQRPDLYQAIRQHVLGIQQLMMPAAPAPQPGQPGGGPPTGEAVDRAVHSGAIRPAGPPSGEALDQAVQSGAIHPAGTGTAMEGFNALGGGAGGSSLNDILAQHARTPPRAEGAPS